MLAVSCQEGCGKFIDMRNPFTHVGEVVGGLYNEAAGSDCAPGPAKAAVTMVLPLVVPFSFIHAFFLKSK